LSVYYALDHFQIMSDSDSLSRRPDYSDNRLIDFSAAAATGLALCFFLMSWNVFHLLPDIEMASVQIGSFMVAAAVVLPWRGRIRARWGWVAIAALGVAFTLSALAAMDWASGVDDCACGEAPPSDILIALVMLLPALTFMGAAHYLGLLIARKRRRLS
jgi:hypothetical protein